MTRGGGDDFGEVCEEELATVMNFGRFAMLIGERLDAGARGGGGFDF